MRVIKNSYPCEVVEVQFKRKLYVNRRKFLLVVVVIFGIVLIAILVVAGLVASIVVAMRPCPRLLGVLLILARQ